MISDFLTRIGRRFGIDAHYLAKNGFIVTSGHAVSILRGLVTGYLVARMFPRELYGQYQLILSIMGAVSAFGLSDLSKAVSRAAAKGNVAVAPTVAKYHVLFCLLGSGMLLAGIAVLPYFGREELWPLLLAGAVLFPLSQVSTVFFGGLAIGQGKFKLGFWANMVWSVLMIAFTGAMLYLHPSALLMLVGVKGIPAVVYFFFAFYMMRGIKPAPKEEAKPILKYGFSLTLMNLPLSLSWYLDSLLISALFGVNQLAVFSIALLIPEQLKVWIGELLPITFSRQARGADTMERRKKLMKQVGFLICVFAVGIALYIALAPYIFHFLFPTYPDAILLSQVAAAILITVPGGLLTQYLEAQAMVRALTMTRWIAAAVFVISLLTLVPTLGLMGALIARGLLRLSYILCTVYYLVRHPPETVK